MSSSESELENTLVESSHQEVVEVLSDPPTHQLNHWEIVMVKVNKGKLAGKTVKHFQCNYCANKYQGPSNGTILKHLRAKHPVKCPELLGKSIVKPTLQRGFFDIIKTKMPFDNDIFTGKLLTWIIKTDQLFSIVDNDHFRQLLEYLKKDINISSRQTTMRRLEELYSQKRGD